MPRSLRMSVDELLKRGLISKEQAKELKQTAPRSKRSKVSNRNSLSGLVCPIDGTTPQEILWRRIVSVWPRQARWEYENAIPGRKYRLDIAFPDIKLCIEFDGWQYHGKYKSDFQRDREKQNLLQMHGWSVLRFYYKEINNDIESAIDSISHMVEQLRYKS